MPQKGWKNINIPEEQVEYIENLIGRSKIKARYAFRSVPDFIRTAISEFITRLEEELEEI